MTTEDRVNHVNDVMYNAWRSMDPGNMGCIVYVFDTDEHGWGAGFNSKNCDTGDAMVAIKRIAERFEIDLEELAASL
jgi:hypothetical protein